MKILETKQVDIKELKGWEDNPRTIEEDDLERLKVQIEKLGQYKPFLVDEDMTVLGGNMRLKALQELNVEKVWVTVVEAKTQEEKIKYALSDNDRVGSYDEEKLRSLIEGVGDFDTELFHVDLGDTMDIGELFDVKSATETAARELDKDKSEEQAQNYLNADIKQIVFYFLVDDYESVLSRVHSVNTETGKETTREALLTLLDFFDKKIPE